MTHKEYEYIKLNIESEGGVDCYFRWAREATSSETTEKYCKKCIIKKATKKLNIDTPGCSMSSSFKACVYLLKYNYIDMIKDILEVPE